MSKSAKKTNSDRRREEKRKRKAANAAHYASLIGTGQNKKRKGSLAGGKKIPGHPHTSGDCGNVGCKRCFPNY